MKTRTAFALIPWFKSLPPERGKARMGVHVLNLPSYIKLRLHIQNIVTQLILVTVIKRYTPILTFPLSGGRDSTHCMLFELYLCRYLCPGGVGLKTPLLRERGRGDGRGMK